MCDHISSFVLWLISDKGQPWITNTISVIAILVASWFTKNSWKTAQHANLIAITKMLIDSDIESKNTKLERLKNKNKKLDHHFHKLDKACHENLLNIYEISCGFYLSNGVDKTRFKKLYKPSIIGLYNLKYTSKGKKYRRLVDADSPYTAIRKVYDEFKEKE